MSYLIICTSLNPESKSRLMAEAAQEDLAKQGIDAPLLNLADYSLPLCDGHEAYDHPDAVKVAEIIRGARGILLAIPIYNFYGNAAAKNLIELAGNAWKEKVIGFLCAAGGKSSYMSAMGLATSLMLDFRCLILPKFVYATGESFEDGTITDSKIRERITELTQTLVKVSKVVNEA
jgi:FMN reductase